MSLFISFSRILQGQRGRLHPSAWRIFVPWPGLILWPLHWEFGILITGPRKSQHRTTIYVKVFPRYMILFCCYFKQNLLFYITMLYVIQYFILYYLYCILRLLRWLSGEDTPCNARDTGDVGSISGLGRSPERGHGNPLQYACLENSMDRGTWWATVCGIAMSWTWLNDDNTHTQITKVWETRCRAVSF